MSCYQTERDLIERPFRSLEQLAFWVEKVLGLRVPRTPVVPGNNAPMEYLWRAYREPAEDLIVWASRGGGKTRLGAVATLLDLLHKPNVQIRILGGSMDQSLRMWDYLLPDLERCGQRQLISDTRSRRGRTIHLISGSRAAVLPQSQRAVRGLRLQKLRCDEVEMFDPLVWDAAQLVTRSTTVPRNVEARYAGDYPDVIRGTIEAMSTFHRPWGLMRKVVDNATAHGIRVLKWSVLDVLEKCPPQRDCATCPLHPECRGIAKHACDGFYPIDDAIAQKRRVSDETWAAEMLCNRPSSEGRVFRTFDPRVHVIDRDVEPSRWQDFALGIDFGFRNPLVCLWIVRTHAGETIVIDEYVRRERVLHEHLAEIESRRWGAPRWIGCDPAGSGPNDQTAQSNVQFLRNAGYRVRTAGSRIQDGLEHIRLGLKPATGPATLFVHARCTALIRAMESYHYKPTGASETPDKDGEHDHPIDALRYYFVNRSKGEATGGRSY